MSHFMAVILSRPDLPRWPVGPGDTVGCAVMKRWDAALIVAGLPTAVVGWLVTETAEGRFITLMTTIGAVLARVAVNHSITRAPRLVVRYANPAAGDRPVVWNHPDGRTSTGTLQVLVENRGQGPARAVEVEFDHLGLELFNATGNPPNPQELDFRVFPIRFTGGERVLNPDDSPWRIASCRRSIRISAGRRA
jgi:hypothetical protein